MNDDRPSDVPPLGEVDTTPPNAPEPEQQSGGWKMPEPKFQKTSGYLPQGYLDQVDAAGQATQRAPENDVHGPAAVPSAQVEAQPDLNEQIADIPALAAPTSVVNQRSPAVRITLIVLGLLAMIGFVAVFLAVIYFLFLAPQASGQF